MCVYVCVCVPSALATVVIDERTDVAFVKHLFGQLLLYYKCEQSCDHLLGLVKLEDNTADSLAPILTSDLKYWAGH